MNAIQQIYHSVHIVDIVQIAILYFAFYAILKAARGSRFGQVLTGAGILFVVLLTFTYVLHFEVLSRIVQGLLFYLALSTVVIFQPEIRRILATLGSLMFQEHGREISTSDRLTPERFTDSVFDLAERRIGALLAFERGISLGAYEASGVKVDARISSELLISIFTEPLPLHDGGAIIRKGRLAAAHCLFPVSSQSDLSMSGMRHRAAVGLSEETDALVVVVSEETGCVSIAHNGRLFRYGSGRRSAAPSVLRWVRKAMPQRQKTASDRVAEWLRARFRKDAPKRTDAEPAKTKSTSDSNTTADSPTQKEAVK